MICAKDDSGINCDDCTCMYNPVVVIATHLRNEITTKNIELLKQQKHVPKIVIVCSLQHELEYYKELQVTVVLEKNRPLGKKWQTGVNVAMKLGANPLIILGSDDLISKDYIHNALLKIKEGFDFIGTTSWYSFDVKNKALYKSKYSNRNENLPIGSGKVYTKELLDKIRWKVFDQSADRKLDDQGQKMISGCKAFIYKEPKVLAIKGNWDQMNHIDAYLRSPNIKTEKSDVSVLKEFGYV